MSYDELEQSPLTLLFHERLYFPLLLDYAMEEGFSELLLFLIETDKLRSDESGGQDQSPGSSSSIAPSVFNRIYDTYIRNESKVFQCAKAAGISCDALESILDTGIPLQTLFAPICDCVWKEVLRRIKMLPDSSMWPSVRKAIVTEDIKIELLTVLSSNSYRLYYEMNLRTYNSAADLGCLHCWYEVREVINFATSGIKTNNEQAQRGGTQSQSHNQSHDSSSSSSGSSGNSNQNQTQNNLNLNRGGHQRRSFSSMAAAGAKKALMSFGSSQRHASISVQIGQDFEDPLNTLRQLLLRTRKLQSKFFTVNSVNSVIPGLAQESTGGVEARAGADINNLSMDMDMDMDRVKCAGLTTQTRGEIASTLDMAKDVRTADIEAVDPAFAVACSGSLLRLLRVVERETFQHLQQCFPSFLQSTEFTLMIASCKAQQSPSVQAYLKKCLFLEDRVRREQMVPWTDPEARGKTYLFCSQNFNRDTSDSDEERDEIKREEKEMDDSMEMSLGNMKLKGSNGSDGGSDSNSNDPDLKAGCGNTQIDADTAPEVLFAATCCILVDGDGVKGEKGSGDKESQAWSAALPAASAEASDSDLHLVPVREALWMSVREKRQQQQQQQELNTNKDSKENKENKEIKGSKGNDALVTRAVREILEGCQTEQTKQFLMMAYVAQTNSCSQTQRDSQKGANNEPKNSSTVPTGEEEEEVDSDSDTSLCQSFLLHPRHKKCLTLLALLHPVLASRGVGEGGNQSRSSRTRSQKSKSTAGGHNTHALSLSYMQQQTLSISMCLRIEASDEHGGNGPARVRVGVCVMGSASAGRVSLAREVARASAMAPLNTMNTTVSQQGLPLHFPQCRFIQKKSAVQPTSVIPGVLLLNPLYAARAGPKVGQEEATQRISDIYDLAVGPLDYALLPSLQAVPLRSLLQILFLLLSGRSVVLVSQCSTILTRLMAAIPRIVWPFKLADTHTQTQLHSTAEFETWLSESGPGGDTQDSEFDCLGNSRAWLVGTTHAAYASLPLDTRRRLSLTAVSDEGGTIPGHWHSGVAVMDLELGELLHTQSTKSFVSYNTAATSKFCNPFAVRRLASLAFQCLENDVHCASLIQETEIEIETEIEGERAHKSSTHNNNNRNHNNYNNHNNNSCSENQKWAIMKRSNAKVDEAFSRYFTNLFLRFLPMNTYHYPQQAVVACDVRAFLAKSAYASSCVSSFSFSVPSSSSSSYAGNNDDDGSDYEEQYEGHGQGQGQGQRQEQEHLSSNSNLNVPLNLPLPELCDVEQDFVTEAVGLNSPSFQSLLLRLGEALFLPLPIPLSCNENEEEQ